MTQYKNNINSTGLSISDAAPIDDREYFASLITLEAAVLDAAGGFVYRLFDGFIANMKDTKYRYIWEESDFGALAVGHTYPSYADNINGQNYANKTYNFVLYEPSARYTLKYSDASAAGIVISKNLLPYHALKDPASITAVFRSDQDAYKEQQYPSHIDVSADSITIVMDPLPVHNEMFKIILT